MIRKTPSGLFIVLVLLALALTGCRARRPTPTPVPATPTPAPTSTPVPATPMPEGWVKHETPRLVLGLPATWEVLEVDQGDLNKLFTEFQARNPDLAGIIGNAEALQGVYLWAFNTTDADPAINNLNIRRTDLGNGQGSDMQTLASSIVAQYRQLGFEVKDTQANLTIGGRPAARIVYAFPMTDSAGRSITAEGYQYLIATGINLWILSYTIDPNLAATLQPVIEQSARSFQAK